MSMNTIQRLTAGIIATAVILIPAACGDDDPAAPTLVAAEDAVVAMNPTVAGALDGVTFNFAGGAGAIAPALAGQDLALTFEGPASDLTAGGVIKSPSGTVLGSFEADVSFGSCIFVVGNSTFPAGHPLANGQTVTVNPCNININTTGATANGQATSRSVALLLGAAASAGATVTVAVNAGGQIVLNGKTVATITLTPVSG